MFHNIGMFLSAGLLALLCAGCTTLGKVDASATLKPGEAYFVIGIAPAKTRVFIVDGALDGGVFKRNAASAAMPFSAALMDAPQDGFVLGKTQGGTTLGLHRVFDESGFPAVAFGPCRDGSKELTFTPAAGTVVYLTSVAFRREGSSLAPAYADDIESARAFLKTHYPNLADKLEHGNYVLAVASESCPPNLY